MNDSICFKQHPFQIARSHECSVFQSPDTPSGQIQEPLDLPWLHPEGAWFSSFHRYTHGFLFDILGLRELFSMALIPQ